MGLQAASAAIQQMQVHVDMARTVLADASHGILSLAVLCFGDLPGLRHLCMTTDSQQDHLTESAYE